MSNKKTLSAERWEIARQALIKRRDALGWSNYRLAAETGIPEPSVSRYMTGKVVPSADTFIRMIKGLNFNAYLVPEEKDRRPIERGSINITK